MSMKLDGYLTISTSKDIRASNPECLDTDVKDPPNYCQGEY